MKTIPLRSFSFLLPLFVKVPRKKLARLLWVALGTGISTSALAALPPSSCSVGGPYAGISNTANNIDGSTIKNNYCYEISHVLGVTKRAIGGYQVNFTLPAPSKVTTITKGGLSSEGHDNSGIISFSQGFLTLDNVDVYVSGDPSNGSVGNGLAGLISADRSTLNITGNVNAYVDYGAIGIYASNSVLNVEKSSVVNAGLGG